MLQQNVNRCCSQMAQCTVCKFQILMQSFSGLNNLYFTVKDCKFRLIRLTRAWNDARSAVSNARRNGGCADLIRTATRVQHRLGRLLGQAQRHDQMIRELIANAEENHRKLMSILQCNNQREVVRKPKRF